jgi:hypothetical protein
MSKHPAEIAGWDDWWEKNFQSIPAFEPLIKHIFEKENQHYMWLERCQVVCESWMLDKK